MRRAQAQQIAFWLEDPLNPGTGKDGLTWAAGDVKILKDGAAPTNTTNLPVAASTGAHKGLYTLQLTSDEMNVGFALVSIAHASAYPRVVPIATDGAPVFAVVSDAGNTASTFKTDRTEAVADYWKRNLVSWVTGNLRGQQALISGYDGTSKFITVANAFTGAPAAGDLALIVNV